MILTVNDFFKCFVDWVDMHLVIVHETVVLRMRVLLEPDVESAFALVMITCLMARCPIGAHHSYLHVVLVIIH